MGDLRLVGGERESEGRVEICEEGFWGTVCDSGLGRKEAFVVCKQLGMDTSGMYTVKPFSVDLLHVKYLVIKSSLQRWKN